MNRLERTLQVSVYAMAALSSFMLGMGEQVWVYVAVLWMAAVAAHFYTDRWQRVVLPRGVSNGLALAAAALAFYEIVVGGEEYQLLGVAHFLVYLQVIIFFQRKGPREYTQIAVLSLFQVMVAAVVNLNVSFALLLAAELFLSLWVLLLLQLNRQWHLHRAVVLEPISAAPKALFPATTDQNQFSNTAALGADSEFPGSRLGRCAVAMGLASMALAILVFPVVPRVRQVRWMGAAPVATTGISDEMKLGDVSRVLESDEEVMTVALRDNATGKTYKAPGDLLLRGYVLSYYRQGHWERAPVARARPLASGYDEYRSVRQEIELHKNEVGVLYAVPPVDTALYGFDDEARPLLRDEQTGVLLPPEGFDARKLRYTVYTPSQGLLTGYSGDLAPPRSHMSQEMLQIPTSLKRLKSFAESRAEGIVPEPGRDQPSQLRIARDFEAYFLDAHRFTYSLEGAIPAPGASQVDPVENFLFNTKSGYCEYFASALTLMLRAVKIPARMVAGFKGGEYNHLGDYYDILDRHAHNWVEAYVAGPDGNPRWIVLDPTPPVAELGDVELANSWISRFRAWVNYYQHLWSRYVVDLDNSRQQRFLRDAGNDLFERLARWRDSVAGGGTFDGLYGQSGRGGLWGRVSAVVMGAVILAGGVTLVWLFVRGLSGLARRLRFRRRGSEDRGRVTVELYRRLVDVLEHHRVVRSPATTHREFARQASEILASRAETQAVAQVPPRVVDVFHRIRFGHESVVPEQEAELLAAVSDLEARMNGGNGNGKHRARFWQAR